MSFSPKFKEKGEDADLEKKKDLQEGEKGGYKKATNLAIDRKLATPSGAWVVKQRGRLPFPQSVPRNAGGDRRGRLKKASMVKRGKRLQAWFEAR